MRAVQLVTVSLPDLESAIERVLTRMQSGLRHQEMQQAHAMSLVAAARLAHVRKAVLQAAAESGACPAKRKGRRWTLISGDVERWVRAGKPVKP